MRATMSFEDKRRALLDAATQNSGGKGISQEVEFADNDIPEFLKQWKKFQAESRKVRILAK